MSERSIAPTQQAAVPAVSQVPGGALQRQCACGQHAMGGECEGCKKNHGKALHRQKAVPTTGGVPPIVHDVLNSPGEPLDTPTRFLMESTFAHDFSPVRVHTDMQAAESARAVQALAYTVKYDVVFSSDRYKPGTLGGNALLAHELTHVRQQAGSPASSTLRIADSSLHEEQANRFSFAMLNPQPRSEPPTRAPYSLAKFSYTGHHVIEEAGLAGANFSPQQMKAIEKGNVQRDYSQVGVVGNFALLCDPRGFGGYKAEEHFDNFTFDTKNNRWRTRGTGSSRFLHQDLNKPDRSPLDYVRSELTALAKGGMSNENLVHLGNAFHTIEDFFAHSNFVELTNGDARFGRDLLTGSYEGESANTEASLSHTLGSVSGPPMQEYYEAQGKAATARTEPLSHSRIAKDVPGTNNYEQARRLAALVIQQLGRDVQIAMKPEDANQRAELMEKLVLTKIHQYLRPPNPQDRWWERLAVDDKGVINQRLKEAEQRTPVTVNQCVFSPLRNLEASSTSSWKIPIGIAIPVQIGSDRIWIQGGGGVTTPLPLDRSVRDDPSRSTERGGVFGGVQITGRF